MDIVWTCLCFYHLHLPLMTQLPEYLPYITFQLMVYYFPLVFWSKYHMILAPITGM